MTNETSKAIEGNGVPAAYRAVRAVPSVEYPTIQSGIDAAADGDTVLVADGTYVGVGNKNLDLLGKNIIVKSQNGPNTCIIDAEFNGRGFSLSGGEPDTARIEGFSIINGWPQGFGGGMELYYTRAVISNCIIRNCYGNDYGGGIYIRYGQPTVRNCVVKNNSCDITGGGIWCGHNDGVAIVDSIVADNVAAIHNGGGIYLSHTEAMLRNVTVAFNVADDGGAGVYFSNTAASISNCILWGNTNSNGLQSYSHTTSGSAFLEVTYCNIEGGETPSIGFAQQNWGEGNIELDPLFVDAPSGDYHLTAKSPCINGGDPSFISDGDTKDIDGDARIMDGRVDMGADERFQDKNRFISFNPKNTGSAVAFRVELMDLVCNAGGQACTVETDCSAGETCDERGPPVMLGWVSDPFLPDEVLTGIPAGTVITATVQKDMPAPRVWTEAVVHLGDCEIAPVHTYAISATGDGATFSEPLFVSTIAKPQGKFWGDLVGSFDGTQWDGPNGLINVNDVLAWIAFKTFRPAPHVTVMDLGGEQPNFLINATDLGLVLQAFRGRRYPPPAFANRGGPADCP